jgi:glycosyltransferase involved in cell wall biosynthesis
MKISVCIPQYNRIEYLLVVLKSIAAQTYKNVEVTISDDCSTDNSESSIAAFIDSTTLPIIYERQKSNIGYDANLRRSLELATGDYLFILGNDDAFADQESLETLVQQLSINNNPGVAVTNYAEFSDPQIVYRRVQDTMLVSGNQAAVRNYSCFSFVAGICFRRDVFHKVNTTKHDGSIYVQIYLAVAALLSGEKLLKISNPLVVKDVVLNDQKSNSYRDKIARNFKDLSPVDGGLPQVISVVFDAIDVSNSDDKASLQHEVLRRIYLTTYPYWLLDYRRNGALPEAIRLSRGLLPRRVEKKISGVRSLKTRLYYAFATITGLLFPVVIFSIVERKLYALLKSK